MVKGHTVPKYWYKRAIKCANTILVIFIWYYRSNKGHLQGVPAEYRGVLV